MRTSKIVALVATAALLVVGTAFASFAAGKTGWDNSEGVWKYYKNGEIVTSDWAKSGSDYYYLDENGEMATEKLIEDEYLYYVDAEGKMVKGNWVKLANPDDDPTSEFVYYYFQKSGKAHKCTGTAPQFKTIDGKKYAFDSDGRMLWGWIKEDSASLTNLDADSTEWRDSLYYLGDANDGAMATGWRKLAVYDDNADLKGENDQEYYFYFASTGKKISNKKDKTIDGKKYGFAADGHMVNSLVATSPSIASGSEGEKTDSAANYMYFSTPEDGARYAKKWFKAIPTEKMHSASNADEEYHWYYAKSDASLAKDTYITWNGKKYAFGTNGEMLSGLYSLTIDAAEKTVVVNEKIEDAAALNKYTEQGKGDNNTGIYFFGDEATDGAMKTGTTKVEIDGDEYTFKFTTSGNEAGKGVQKYNSGSYYVNGRKLCADADDKYQLIQHTATYTEESPTSDIDFEKNLFTSARVVAKGTAAGKTYTPTVNYAVVSSTGALKKSGTVTDADGYKIKVSNFIVKEIVAPK